MTDDPRRALPAVGTILEFEEVRALEASAPRDVVADAARAAIERLRRSPEAIPASLDAWPALIEAELARRLAPSLRPVLNATGVVLHTNLGRAPLAAAALDAVRDIAGGFSNLEYDLESGTRGSRHAHCAALLCELTGAEDAIVVNNGAAALVLALNSVAAGRDAIISRGELVEIGGTFRVPDIMAASGARLLEVGTTNRTHAGDYRRALSPETGAIVSVHRSNFVIEGYVASVSPAELVPIAGEASVPLLYDFGSGLLLDLTAYGLRGEPTARDAVRAGASLVLMSGDKLLGGPQAGIILGAASLIAALKRNPLARAMRADKMTLAALEATLAIYREPARAVREIPALAMLTARPATIEARALRVVHAIAAHGIASSVMSTEATVGGGAFPTARIPSFAVALATRSADQTFAALRSAPRAVIGRIAEGRVLLDLRGIAPDDDAHLATIVAGALAGALSRAHA
jgi:L-seryl-tRNA(Ser) seleniumtransferase